jgi:hypothetical protein
MDRRAAQLSRERWEDHPSYPSQVLLVGSHDNFLAINDYLADQARRAAEPWRLEVRYRYWIAAMRSHERYEEQKLYPYLEQRFGVSFDPSRAGHARLHAKHEAVLAAFAAFDPDLAPTRDDLVLALQEHRETLHEHLELEEAAVVPLLLELSREEFRRYYALPLERLLESSAG